MAVHHVIRGATASSAASRGVRSLLSSPGRGFAPRIEALDRGEGAGRSTSPVCSFLVEPSRFVTEILLPKRSANDGSALAAVRGGGITLVQQQRQRPFLSYRSQRRAPSVCGAGFPSSPLEGLQQARVTFLGVDEP